ncbi:MAG: ABC transporter substrate-binding protein [Anaerolineae bacterium]|nr:ABC transporter substrate-binding protein [Anaerolineae bacterium]
MAAGVLLWRMARRGEDAVWARIQRSGVWRVGMDPSFPPFEGLDGQGQPVGYDVDLARAIAARWGVAVSFEGIGFDGLVAALWAHRADSVISALPLDPRLTRDVAYSIPYFDAGLLLVVAEGRADIAGPDDLAGRRLAVEWGSEGDVQGRALRGHLEGLTLLTFALPQDALAAVVAGQADAALADAVTVRQFQGEHGGLHAVGPPLVSVPYVIAVPRQAPQLLAAVNEALVALREDGTLARLEERWFGQEEQL